MSSTTDMPPHVEVDHDAQVSPASSTSSPHPIENESHWENDSTSLNIGNTDTQYMSKHKPYKNESTQTDAIRQEHMDDEVDGASYYNRLRQPDPSTQNAQISQPKNNYDTNSPIASVVKRSPKPNHTQQQQSKQEQLAMDMIDASPHTTHFNLADRPDFMSGYTGLDKMLRRPGSVVIRQTSPVHNYLPFSVQSFLSYLQKALVDVENKDKRLHLKKLANYFLADDVYLEEDDFEPFIFIKNLPDLSTLGPNRKSPIPRKSKYAPNITLALDLDETLVHCSIHPMENPEFTFRVNFNNADYEVYVRIRPHLEYFLKQVSQWFEVIIFTASQKVYADSLLNIIDPRNEFITHRIFRDSCVFFNGNYMKDLNILGRPLDKVVIVDNSFQAFGFQLDNGIPIESWFEDENDIELLHLIPFLRHLKDVNDVRPHIRRAFNLSKLVEAIVPSDSS